MALWAGCAAAYTRAALLDAHACRVGVTALAGVAIAAVVIFALVRKPAVGLLVACALAGAALGFAEAALNFDEAIIARDVDVRECRITLEGDSRQSLSGESAIATIEVQHGARLRVHADFPDGKPLMNGTVGIVTGSLEAASFPEDSSLWSRDAIGRLRVRSFEQEQAGGLVGALLDVRSRAVNSIGNQDDARALLQAVVCGWRHSITSSAWYARFLECGLAHLVAVSGAHLVIVTSLCAAALNALHVGRRTSAVLLAAMMGTYLVLAGIPVSGVRAALMSSVGVLAIFGRRRPSAQNALGIGIVGIILASPAASVSVSFVLSALSTAGIVVFSPLFSHMMGKLLHLRLSFAAESLALTLSASMLSQPFACSVFGVLPLASPVANVVCAPLFPIVCACGMASAVAGCLSLPFSQLFVSIASLPACIFGSLVDVVSSLPYASIPVSVSTLQAVIGSVAAAVVAYLAWSAVKLRHVVGAIAVTLAVGAGVSFAATQEDAIIMLDVGQGDAFLVRSRGASLLIDTGNHDAQLIEQLAQCHVAKVDSVLLTHSDDDHAGSLDALERAVGVDRVIVAEGVGESASGKNRELMNQARRTAPDILTVKAGDAFRIGAFHATVVWPRTLVDDGGNADSVCLLVEYDGDDDGVVDFRALFTGDAEREQLARIVNGGQVGDIDVLKVGHHGSRGGLDEEIVRVLRPEIALIGVGAHNRYGHPAPETLEMLRAVGCEVFRTDEDGQVKCAFTPDAIRIEIQ